MSIYEVLSLSFSLLAIIISIVSISKVNMFSLANIELYLNERITDTKVKVSELSEKIMILNSKTKKTVEDKRLLENYKFLFNTAIENNLNVYEEACAKYLDRKIDRKRFEKTYRTEIRQLVEKTEFSEYFDKVSSRYRAIRKVYDGWENLEK